MAAIAHWEEKTPINFVNRTSQNDYVEFVRGDLANACSSYVGRVGGKQEIRLTSSGDCGTGTLIHEIGHAVGLYHEQSREDRDDHVTIMWDNIQSEEEGNFEKHVSDATDVGAYDFDSIMHYGATAFSRNGQPTIVTKPVGRSIGQRNGLSQGDINTVLHIYNIVKHPRFLEDVDGDGKKDVVAFGNDGVYVSLSTGSSFTQPSRWSSSYGHNTGWRVDRYPRLLADVNGDGKQDVVGFGQRGVYVSLSTGSSFTQQNRWNTTYDYNSGWRVSRHPRFLGCVDKQSQKLHA